MALRVVTRHHKLSVSFQLPLAILHPYQVSMPRSVIITSKMCYFKFIRFLPDFGPEFMTGPVRIRMMNFDEEGRQTGPFSVCLALLIAVQRVNKRLLQSHAPHCTLPASGLPSRLSMPAAAADGGVCGTATWYASNLAAMTESSSVCVSGGAAR
jgi:hypothetical protein